MVSPPESAATQPNPLVKLLLDVGPLAVFFFVNSQYDIFAATAGFMAATAVSLIACFLLYRKVPVMLLVSGAVVMVFGGLTVFLHEDTFIKLKPTIVYMLFATVLLGGLAFGKTLLVYVFDTVLQLTDEGWKQLTVRWGLFFIALALLNEIVWRSVSTDTWVNFKVFVTIPLTMGFFLAQVPLIKRHSIPDEAASE